MKELPSLRKTLMSRSVTMFFKRLFRKEGMREGRNEIQGRNEKEKIFSEQFCQQEETINIL